MNEIVTVVTHELNAFKKSGKSSLFLVLITALVWGGMISTKVETIESAGSFMWVIFFAMVASAGLSTTVFVRERLSSTLEVLIMSGLERNNILFGKLFFTTAMSILIGFVSFFIAYIVKTVILQDPFFLFSDLLKAISIFVSSALLVNSSSAFFSMALSNPRLVQFLNFTLLTIISVGYALFAELVHDSLWWLSATMIALSILFTLFSLRLFRSEKIIQPLIY